MGDSLELSFPCSAREHADAYFASRAGRRVRRFIHAGGAVIAGSAIFASILSAVSGESGYFADMASLGALGAFWMFIAP
jgi:hypothetical protein